MHDHRSDRYTRLHRALGRVLLAAILVLAGLTAVRTQTDDAVSAADRSDGKAQGLAARELAPVDLDQVGSGELLWKSDRGLLPLPVIETQVDLSVTGLMIHGRVGQSFHNPTGEVIEAVYVFPLPSRAAVHHMEILVGDRRIVSVVQEKEEARRTYETAKAEGRKTALVAQRRPNLFTTSVANINPGESIEVALEYFEEASYQDGTFRLRFPLTFTPRFMPPGAAAREAERGPRSELDRHRRATPSAAIRVRLQPGFALNELESRSHSIEASPSDGSWEVVTRPSRVVADRDFLLRWRPALGDEPQAAAFVEERGEERYALIMLVPPLQDSPAGLGLPTETLFVIDISGSMQGPSILQARRALLASLDRLRPEDRFNILKFNGASEPFRPEFEQAEPAALDAARAWVRDLRAEGGTMIYPALLRGLQMMGDSRSSHVQRIVFLTDGAVGNEQELLRAIVEQLGETRLHTIGIGQAPNAYLMRKMADLGRGLCEFISDSLEAEHRVEAFFERLDRPVMTDIAWETEGIEIEDPHPARLTDLHAGEPMFLSARLTGGATRGELTLGGHTRSGRLSTGVRIDERTPRGDGIAVRWARARVEDVMDGLHEGADAGAVRAEVVELGLAYDLVTAYTSLVAVDDSPSALGVPRPVRMAALLPRGGTGGPLRLLAGWVLLALGCLLLALAWPGFTK